MATARLHYETPEERGAAGESQVGAEIDRESGGLQIAFY